VIFSRGQIAERDVVAALRAAGCVFAEDEAALLLAEARTTAELAVLVRRRVDGEPLEQILGWAEFDGLRVRVEPGVFVPRRRTRLLVVRIVDAVQALGAAAGRPVVVVDLCCGSGAVAAAVAARLARDGGAAELHAADIDPAAVRCARRNLAGTAAVHQGDLCAALPARLRGRVDVLAASPPYVPTDAVALMPPEARLHEPPVALDGGPDGLDVVRRIVAEARTWLAADGLLLVDLSAEQAPAATAALARGGFTARTTSDQHVGATVVAGTRPTRGAS
jgi:release factor glutamine methyltransferase